MKTSTPEQPKTPSPLKILLLGMPGCRKTTFGLQFPKVHVMDCDGNLDGPREMLVKGNKEVKPILPTLSFTYDSIRRDDDGKVIDISDCFDRLSDKLRLFGSDPSYQARETVFVDSLSHVNEFIIRKILKLKSKTSMEINLWTDFATNAYSLIVARLEQTGKTVLCSCHLEKITEADNANIMKKKLVELNPAFSGRVGDSLGAFFTDVWLMEKKRVAGGKIECWLKTDVTDKCEHLKNSLGLLPELDVTKGFSALEPYLKGRI